MTRPGGEDLPFVFSGTLVVQGQGIAQVRATGIHTEMGKIGKALQTVQIEGTLLQREIGRLVRRLAIVGLGPVRRRGRCLRPHPWQLAHRDSWPGSRWRWRCCPKNSRSC